MSESFFFLQDVRDPLNSPRAVIDSNKSCPFTMPFPPQAVSGKIRRGG